MDWITNTEIGLDLSNSVFKRLRCNMVTHVFILQWEYVMSSTKSVTTEVFLENMRTLKAIKSHFKGHRELTIS